jgi:hypothetical protein
MTWLTVTLTSELMKSPVTSIGWPTLNILAAGEPSGVELGSIDAVGLALVVGGTACADGPLAVAAVVAGTAPALHAVNVKEAVKPTATRAAIAVIFIGLFSSSWC